MNGRAVNPYHVLLSETMLQQTQVATVIAYFHRFIAALPTLESLAAADEQKVLRLWQGLGYYRRARNLHAAAREIVRDNGGRVPGKVDELLELPGVGPYTAGAIASIAYDRPAAILDGNVIRVLSRWFAIDEPVDLPATRDRLWKLAATLVPAKAAGDYNQAMMELGALVCTPKQPACLTCPVAMLCRANEEHRVEELPVKSPRREPRAAEHHVVVVRDGDRYLFEQRPSTGLWSNMWQFPTAEALALPVKTSHIATWLRKHRAIAIPAPQCVGDFTHQTTHRTIRFVVWQAIARRGDSRSKKLKTDAATQQQWRHLDDIDDLPLPNPQRRVVQMLVNPARAAVGMAT